MRLKKKKKKKLYKNYELCNLDDSKKLIVTCKGNSYTLMLNNVLHSCVASVTTTKPIPVIPTNPCVRKCVPPRMNLCLP